jgi:hypothetical protein
VNARKSLISLLPLFSLIKVTSVFAHNYLPADPGSTFTKIPDISVSRAAYRELGRIGQVDVYEFDAKKGQEIYIQMTIPQIEALKEFAPRFVLVYTGAEEAEFSPMSLKKGVIVDPPHEVVDAVFPQGSDSKVPPPLGVAYDGSDPLPFDEPFTGTKYWIRQTLTVAAPVDGTYRIGVYAEDQQIGKYVLAPGRKEQFGIGDVFTLPAVRWNVRVFCREPVWPDALFWSVLGAAAVAGIGVGIYYAVPH